MKLFVSVFGDHAPEQFYRGLMWSWTPEQRETKERNVRRWMRVPTLYRINIRPRRVA